MPSVAKQTCDQPFRLRGVIERDDESEHEQLEQSVEKKLFQCLPSTT